MIARIRAVGSAPERLRVLDLGCGTLYPLTLLLHSLGADVIGADLSALRERWPAMRTFRRNRRKFDIWRALRLFCSDLVRWLFYYRRLSRLTGVRLQSEGLKFRRTDAANLDFEDHSFDLVVSFAALEHFLDMQKAVSELRRVLRDGGLAYLNIHMWCSLSGGHEQEFWNGGVPANLHVPWQHLRSSAWSSVIPLNRWRERDYVREFSRYFDVVDRRTEVELGGQLITRQVLAELSDYSDDELVAEQVAFVLRARSFKEAENT